MKAIYIYIYLFTEKLIYIYIYISRCECVLVCAKYLNNTQLATSGRAHSNAEQSGGAAVARHLEGRKAGGVSLNWLRNLQDWLKDIFINILS